MTDSPRKFNALEYWSREVANHCRRAVYDLQIVRALGGKVDPEEVASLRRLARRFARRSKGTEVARDE